MLRFVLYLATLLCLFVPSICAADEPSFQLLYFTLHQNTNPPNWIEWPGRFDVEANITSATTEVQYSIPSGQQWTISFIQQINSCVDRHDYANSFLTWEMPRFPYCDAEANLAKKGQFWYLPGIELKGAGRTELTMGDNPQASYAWSDLAPADSGAPKGDHDLKSAEKRYSFTCWLAAMRKSDKKVVLLKRFDWKLNYYFTVDATAPLGQRAHYVPGKSVIAPPVATDPLPQDLDNLTASGVLSGKESANRDQALWWTAKGDASRRFQVK